MFLPRLDELTHAELDLLADQYHCDFYEPATMSANTKRILIKTSLLQHFVKGTPYAVRQLLNTIGTNAKIIEWYNDENEDRPYYFRVIFEKGQYLDDDTAATLIRAIEAAKNARSWLSNIQHYFPLGEQPIYFANVPAISDKIDIANNPVQDENHSVYLAQVATISNKTNIQTNTFANVEGAFYVGGAVSLSTFISIDADESEKPIEPIPPPEPDDEIITGDFVKLFLSFHCSQESRLLVFKNARTDLAFGIERKNIPVDGIFKSRKGYLSDRVESAFLVHRILKSLVF